jgi:pantothenate kinase type III
MNTNNSMKTLKCSADIGNSRIKLMLNNEVWSLDYRTDDARISLYDIFKEYFDNSSEGIIKIYYSFVNNDGMAFLKDFADRHTNIILEPINTILQKQKFIKFDTGLSIGSDRLLGLISASDEYGLPTITIDCGTAVTINVAKQYDNVQNLNDDYKAEFIGGTIFAGPETQIISLDKATSALSYQRIEPVQMIISGKTSEALNSGIINGIAGGIKYITEQIKSEIFTNSEVNIILTGGYSEIIAYILNNWRQRIILDKNLVLKGINLLSYEL